MLARPVAIKFIADFDIAARQRFLLEARAVAQVHHPNVIAIYRVGTLEGRPYLVTELVRGTPLAKLDKPMTWQVALEIAIGVARGLAAAHRRNVVHCDLKPSNVMIDGDGVAKIVDFGLARIVTESSNAGHLPVGTPDYMAPEVWRGETPTRRADVYSLGAMLFELLAGAPPFAEVPAPELRQRVTTGEAPPVRARSPDVNPGLAEVVARCLRRDREARFADGDELREALERLHASRHHVPSTGENPYRGLLPFEASHRGVFFGRRSEVDTVIARLRAEPIVLVTGDSGVGKSSLCRAGVMPAIVEGELGGEWQTLTIVPGRWPLAALGQAVGDPGLASRLRDTPALLPRELRRHAGDRSLLLFIDQLEELITLGDSGEVAALDAGFAAIVEGVPGLRLLATVRADFLARISTLPGLGRDLSRLLYFLRPLPPERLRDVIVGPAAAVGTQFESEAIVDDLCAATAQAGSGGLPLLSFALADLWEARDHATNLISRAAVDAMGGVTGALSRHADVVIGSMAVEDRRYARAILLRLVTALGTRTRRSARELLPQESAGKALDALVKGRLVVVHDGESEAVYELAHECLLTGWTTLKQWLEDDSADRATRERLTAATAEWLRLGRRADATWRGTRLAEAAALDLASLDLDEQEFVAASRRASWRQRMIRGLLTVGVVALVGLAFATQRYLARRELAAAIAEEIGPARAEIRAARATWSTGLDLENRAFSAFDAIRRDEGETLWREFVAHRDAAERAYRNASGRVEVAFAKDPTRADVRDLIGDIVLARALLADHVRDFRQSNELIERLDYYDADRSRRAKWSAKGRVVVHAPATATITLERKPQTNPVSGEPTSRENIGVGSADVLEDPDSYSLSIAMPDRVLVIAPILVERDREQTIDIAPPPRLDQVPEGFVYIPDGEFLYGSASDEDRLTFFNTTPLRRRRTGPFLISRTEVTFGEWLAYLDALPPDERARRTPAVPSKVSGSLEVTPDGAGHWRISLLLEGQRYVAGWNEKIVYPGRRYQAEQDWRRFPVLGVSGEDAAAFALWLDRTGRLPGARLCNEVEWERAARGADGRGYPAGRVPQPTEANVDVTHGSGMMGPDEVGMHPDSRSPFGIDDMCGNAFEWTLSEQGGYIVRSGSYWHDRVTAHLSNRTVMPAMARDAALGMRLCATPPLPQ